MIKAKTVEEITNEAKELSDNIDGTTHEVICLYAPAKGIEFSCSIALAEHVTITHLEAVQLSKQISELLHGKDISLIDAVMCGIAQHVEETYEAHLQVLQMSQTVEFTETASNAYH